jgi:hypothetical protein
MRRVLLVALSAVLALASSGGASGGGGSPVQLVRVPNGGVQPDIAVDAAGAVHIVYLAGEAGASDVFYTRSSDGGRTFSPAVRVNSQKGSAIAAGTIRGAQIALGRNGLVHIAWNGSDIAVPKPPVNPRTGRPGSPMLYSRSTADGTAFEPQRNLITQTTNLDGGGSVAADQRGGVYVAWHAHPASGQGGEEARRVWIARSTDDGARFGAETAITDASAGVCSCCALRLFAAGAGDIYLMYRSAVDKTHRDTQVLVSGDQGRTFRGRRLDRWEIGACPMTSMSIALGGGVLGAWETAGQVYFGRVDGASPPQAPSEVAVDSPVRKHPRLAIDRNGTVLLAWTEDTAWARGGSIAWQAFGPDGKPTDVQGRHAGLPVWSFGAVIPRKDGGFVVMY